MCCNNAGVDVPACLKDLAVFSCLAELERSRFFPIFNCPSPRKVSPCFELQPLCSRAHHYLYSPATLSISSSLPLTTFVMLLFAPVRCSWNLENIFMLEAATVEMRRRSSQPVNHSSTFTAKIILPFQRG